MVGLCIFTGVTVGLQGFSALNQIGTSALTGFLTAYFNTREIAPLVAGLALSSTVGSGLTAQLGAMRISEEIDALEVMAVRSLPYLVTTRIVAGFIAIIPLYVIGLLISYLGSRMITVFFYGQSAGTYDHYFNLFLPPEDVLYSFGKVLLFSLVIVLLHCYFGFRARGGPGGLGRDDHGEGRRMSQQGLGWRIRHRVIGIVYISMIIAFLVSTVAVYKK